MSPSISFCMCVCFCVQEDEMLRQTALRLISVIGYSLSLTSLTLATLLMGMLRSVAAGSGLFFISTLVSFSLLRVVIAEIREHWGITDVQ